ncbi:hypothetical protein [Reichenbachiella sp. MSK19-1]|uniref:hypothetical protein n=1 Tax=Reichenbachiella sp. MSK19-1 TaxID=1897631 RepID=UPI000E6B7F8B|nr:hypothetical protein [Reichenbachiella sp. MSK19-1]RJE75230.1 hypothetical protein BGP76_19210 [Reichenbachiella sp. MSK19-1]
MGTSNTILSIAQVQDDESFISYLATLDSFEIPNPTYREENSRNPTLDEIYNSCKESGIRIIHERTSKDEIAEREGNDITIHSLEIEDAESEYPEDLTVKYESHSKGSSVTSIGGVKTHSRILIKLVTQLTRYCGSMYIINPYESFFIRKGTTYDEIVAKLNEKSS